MEEIHGRLIFEPSIQKFPMSNLGKFKVLIVDSGKIIRKVISSEFSDSKFIVTEVADVEESSKLAKEEQFDLITIGIHLEGGSGFDLCRKIRGRDGNDIKYASSRARILFVTSDFTDKNRIIAHDSGADGFIEKSGDLVTFKSSIAAILHDLLEEKKREADSNSKKTKPLDQKILIVDDSELNLILFRRLLESKGATVFTAISAEHALDILEINFKSISAVFSDLYMPYINGDELCRRILNNPKFAGIRLGITTAAEESSMSSEQIPKDVSIFSKPYNAEELLRFLNGNG